MSASTSRQSALEGISFIGAVGASGENDFAEQDGSAARTIREKG